MARSLFMSMVLLFGNVQAVAQTSDILDDDRVLFLSEDDPRILLGLTRDIIQRGPEGQQELWVRAVWAESPIPNDFGKKASTPETVIKARQLARELGLIRQALDLELDALLERKGQNLREDFVRLRQQAEAMRQPLVASRILREQAFWFYDRGDMQQSIQLQKQAADLLNQAPQVSLIDRLRLKIDMAMIMDSEGQPQRARQLYQEIDEQCEALKLRSMCITNAHEMGLHYSSSADPKDWPLAEIHFKKALEKAHAFQDLWTIAKSQAALARLYAKLQRYPEAIAIGRQAVEGFLPFQDELWIGDAYKKLGSAYLGARQYAEAIDVFQKAQTLIPQDYLLDQSEIHRALAEAYEPLGNAQKTIHHLKAHMTASQNLIKEREAREYSKAMVDLGLRMEEERNKTLQAENELQSQKLKDSEQMRLFLMVSLILATIAMISLLFAGYRSRQLRRGENHMRRILNQIQEGILIFDARLTIQPGYSRYVEGVFGQELVGQHILRDILVHGPFTADELRIFEEVLTLSMSEGSLTWELNQHLLPLELIWRKEPTRVLSLQWQPIFGSKGGMSSILLSFRDITHQKELLEQVAFERLRSDRITRCLQELMQLGPAKASRVFQDMRDFMASCPSWMSNHDQARILRRLHTLKGLARSFGLRDLAQAAHAFEDIFMGRKPTRAEIQAGLEYFDASFKVYQSLEPHLTLSLGSSSPQEKSLFSCLDHLVPNLRLRSAELGLGFHGIAARDLVAHWPRPVMDKLEGIFIHALNNAIDHGYLKPKQEGHPVDKVLIEVEAAEDRQGIHLTIRDYGHGIAWQKLRERAQRFGRSQLSDQELADLVFEDGLSTTDEVSDTSGRGVGMSAVRSLCEDIGGHVHFRSNDRGRGAMLTIYFPQPCALSSGF